MSIAVAVGRGDYLTDEARLWYVLDLHAEMLLLENCVNPDGPIIWFDRAEVEKMRLVRPTGYIPVLT